MSTTRAHQKDLAHVWPWITCALLMLSYGIFLAIRGAMH